LTYLLVSRSSKDHDVLLFPNLSKIFQASSVSFLTNSFPLFHPPPFSFRLPVFRTECKGKRLFYSDQISSNISCDFFRSIRLIINYFVKEQPRFFEADCKGRALIFTTKSFSKNISHILLITTPSFLSLTLPKCFTTSLSPSCLPAVSSHKPFEELSPFVVRGCKDKRVSFPAKSFLTVFSPQPLKLRTVGGFRQEVFLKMPVQTLILAFFEGRRVARRAPDQVRGRLLRNAESAAREKGKRDLRTLPNAYQTLLKRYLNE
jgi:hypothetical protein